MKKENRGGAREGAGRKIQGEQPKNKRYLSQKLTEKEYVFFKSILENCAKENNVILSKALKIIFEFYDNNKQQVTKKGKK